MTVEHIPQTDWKDDTLRWEMSAKYQNRCPTPFAAAGVRFVIT
ncbi:hypothetical protein [Streptomyces sp. NPDC057052]